MPNIDIDKMGICSHCGELNDPKSHSEDCPRWSLLANATHTPGALIHEDLRIAWVAFANASHAAHKRGEILDAKTAMMFYAEIESLINRGIREGAEKSDEVLANPHFDIDWAGSRRVKQNRR